MEQPGDQSTHFRPGTRAVSTLPMMKDAQVGDVVVGGFQGVVIGSDRQRSRSQSADAPDSTRGLWPQI